MARADGDNGLELEETRVQACSYSLFRSLGLGLGLFLYTSCICRDFDVGGGYNRDG